MRKQNIKNVIKYEKIEVHGETLISWWSSYPDCFPIRFWLSGID